MFFSLHHTYLGSTWGEYPDLNPARTIHRAPDQTKNKTSPEIIENTQKKKSRGCDFLRIVDLKFCEPVLAWLVCSVLDDIGDKGL